MNEILALQNLPFAGDDNELGVLKGSTLSVNCTSGHTAFTPVDE